MTPDEQVKALAVGVIRTFNAGELRQIAERPL